MSRKYHAYGRITIESSPVLKYIKIFGLFGDRDVYVDMYDRCSILIGENGMGKTTILSVVYTLLNGNFHELLSFPIKGVEISFSDDNPIRLDEDDLKRYSSSRDWLLNDLNRDTFDNFIKYFIESGESFLSDSLYAKILEDHKEIRRDIDGLMKNFYDYFYEMIEKNRKFFTILSYIHKIGYKCIYLPTYRRIESTKAWESLYQDISYPHIDSYQMVRRFINRMDSEMKLMNFGMKDISARINNLLDEIRRSFAKGFSEISSQMIPMLLLDPDELNSNVSDFLKNEEEIRIVLERIGDNLKAEDKKKILELITTGEIRRKPLLINFLTHLITIYDRKRWYDLSIKMFCDNCNRFLFDKYFYYDENHVDVTLYYRKDKKRSQKISFDRLSSGEKQLISLMAVAFFEFKKELILLIDEPELSLSIQWQRMFFPSLMQAPNCSRILAVTHSPFIFDNELRTKAKGAQEYFSFYGD